MKCRSNKHQLKRIRRYHVATRECYLGVKNRVLECQPEGKIVLFSKFIQITKNKEFLKFHLSYVATICSAREDKRLYFQMSF